ncbi:unnamed protein product [Nippostrongylus brasiliensis]|uniref:STAS domain-containing protein n=1 Tax=Nippostrongylus brasiliensis TaxID=27835 RepID=A0A0N4YFX9_NIPBR|nr:unnamed protein product [Nippostrongylus brasiliensis]
MASPPPFMAARVLFFSLGTLSSGVGYPSELSLQKNRHLAGTMERPPMNQEEFDRQFEYKMPHYKTSTCTKVARVTKKFWRPFTSPRNFAQTVVSFVPILGWLPRYQFKSHLLHDVVGGLTVGIMHVPQGSFAVVALMTGKAVLRLTGNAAGNSMQNCPEANDTLAAAFAPTQVQVASALTVLIGLIQVLVAALGLDFVTTYFSDELVAGFTTGAGFHVFVTQLKDVTGIRGLPRRQGLANLIMKVYDLCANIPRTNLVTLGLSALTILLLLLNKHLVNPFLKKRLHCPVPMPMELIVVILGTLISEFAHLGSNFNVVTVGLIPTGLPPPAVPHFELFPSLIVDAISIAVVVMAIHVSLAKILAKKYQYEIATNQEFYAMGFTSVLSGFFPVFPHSCSLSRTMVSAGAGTSTQCVLASIIIAALLGMFRKFKQLVRLWKLSRIDFSIWVVAFVATVGADVMEGLAIAIVFALFTTVIREQWPRWHILGNISGTADFRDVERYQHIYFFNSVCVLRFDSPLLFTNVERFRRIVENVANDWDNLKCCGKIDKKQFISAEQLEKESEASMDKQKKYLIIDCSGFAYVDVMGVNSLKEIHEELRAKDICVYYAAAKAPVRELFEASGLYASVAKSNFYPTIYDAIAYAQMERKSTPEPASYENHSADMSDSPEETQTRH